MRPTARRIGAVALLVLAAACSGPATTAPGPDSTVADDLGAAAAASTPAVAGTRDGAMPETAADETVGAAAPESPPSDVSRGTSEPAPADTATGARPPAAPAPGGTAAGQPEPVPTLAPSEPFNTADVTLHGPNTEVVVPVYVADQPGLRQRGLMDRESLPEGAGMIFVFPDDHTGGFWMKNTLIPLSIAFADAAGAVLAVLDMDPCSADPCPVYDPEVAYRYALEVNQGFFDDIGLDTGWTIDVSAISPASSG